MDSLTGRLRNLISGGRPFETYPGGPTAERIYLKRYASEAISVLSDSVRKVPVYQHQFRQLQDQCHQLHLIVLDDKWKASDQNNRIARRARRMGARPSDMCPQMINLRNEVELITKISNQVQTWSTWSDDKSGEISKGLASAFQDLQLYLHGKCVVLQANYDGAFDSESQGCLDREIVVSGNCSEAGGSYADVWKGVLRNDREVAIKVARTFGNRGQIQAERLLQRLWREYIAWSSLSHPNVLEYLGFSYECSRESFGVKFPSFVSPWMHNGTVPEYLNHQQDTDRWELVLGVAKGLQYLHTRNPPIIHGDLRAGNILVSDSGEPCLGDFGLSRVISDEMRGMTSSSPPGGSLRWMAPELLDPECLSVTLPSDIWAYGMTVLEIFSGRPPYSDVENEAVVLGLLKEHQLPSQPKKTGAFTPPDNWWHLCMRCWSRHPIQRASMDEVLSVIVLLRPLTDSPIQPPVPSAMSTLIGWPFRFLWAYAATV